jgi:hypothetical protein
MIQSALDQAIGISLPRFANSMMRFASSSRVNAASDPSASALPAVFSFSHAASNAAPKSSVSSLSKAAFESSATIPITGLLSLGAIVQSRWQDFRLHAVALRADVRAQIDLPEGGMGLDAEQPHFAAAARTRDAGHVDRFGSDHSHSCTVTITWGMSTYTFIRAQTPY